MVGKLFKECGINSTFVANTFHPSVFFTVEPLNVASTLARELKLFPARDAGEPGFHVSHHNVHSQVALSARHVSTSLTSCRWIFLSFVNCHVLGFGGLGVEHQRTFVARQFLLDSDRIFMFLCHVLYKVRMRVDG